MLHPSSPSITSITSISPGYQPNHPISPSAQSPHHLIIPNARVTCGFMVCVVALLVASAIAQTPPMGWNSYDCFGYAVNEAEVRENAEYMAAHLKRLGWEYVVIDYVWSSPRLKELNPPTQNARFEPRLAMDEFGRLLPDTARFPSAANGKGFKPLATWLHSKGLKFGIHLMRGIPRQAVGANTPIQGSKLTAADAANVKSPCSWLNHMWGMHMASPAGQAYLDSIFRLYASWGVDFVKVDDLSQPYSTAEVEGYRRAIDHCGRPILLSLSPGPTPLEKANHVNRTANMWRLLGDLWDNWNQLDEAFEPIAMWNPYRKTGHWPDPDMLPLGRLRVYGPPTGPPNTPSRFTDDEAMTLMSLWCIARCPLMFGGNLPQTDSYTLSLITNPTAIAINQHSHNNRPLAGGEFPVWTADSDDPKVKYLALFNRTDRSAEVKVRLSDLGVRGCAVTDVWRGSNRGLSSEELRKEVPAHGTALLVISALELVKRTEPAKLHPNLTGTSYEAEAADNTFTGETHSVTDPGGKCSGGKLVRNIGLRPESRLRFNHVIVPKGGDYVITLMYMSAERRRMFVSVNGGKPVGYSFIQTGGWDGRFLGWKEIVVELKAGENTIELGNPSAWGIDLDRILLHERSTLPAYRGH